jgi:hypothetical protein
MRLISWLKSLGNGTDKEVAVSTDNPLPVQMVGTPADNPAIGATTDAAAAQDGTGNYGLVAGIKRLALNTWAMLGRMPALSNGRVPVMSSIPTAATVVILPPLPTNNVGANFAVFADQACSAIDIVNNTGVVIEYRRGGTGQVMQIPPDAARMVLGLGNANQIGVRRVDQSNTPVTVQAEAFVS